LPPLHIEGNGTGRGKYHRIIGAGVEGYRRSGAWDASWFDVANEINSLKMFYGFEQYVS
jgi:hypothetical protein